jgi:hypothetical protein
MVESLVGRWGNVDGFSPLMYCRHGKKRDSLAMIACHVVQNGILNIDVPVT